MYSINTLIGIKYSQYKQTKKKRKIPNQAKQIRDTMKKNPTHFLSPCFAMSYYHGVQCTPSIIAIIAAIIAAIITSCNPIKTNTKTQTLQTKQNKSKEKKEKKKVKGDTKTPKQQRNNNKKQRTFTCHLKATHKKTTNTPKEKKRGKTKCRACSTLTLIIKITHTSLYSSQIIMNTIHALHK